MFLKFCITFTVFNISQSVCNHDNEHSVLICKFPQMMIITQFLVDKSTTSFAISVSVPFLIVSSCVCGGKVAFKVPSKNSMYCMLFI